MTPFLIEAGGFAVERVADKTLPLIGPLRRKLAYRLKHGRCRILIFGTGGSGKSTLTRYLAAPARKNQEALPYETTEANQNVAFHDPNVVCTIIDTPGQERFRASVTQDMAANLVRGKVNIIINAVCWGHAAIERVGYKETDVFVKHPTPSVKEFVPEWLDEERAKEIAVLRETASHIKVADPDTVIKMVTLVTKQDLWWEHRSDVQRHYTAGDYQRVIDDLASHRGKHHFKHDYLSVSLVMRNLTDGAGEQLVPTTGGYDILIQVQNQANMLRTINNLVTG